ncbi:MAG: dual specificity protein phosphatase family protein [Leptolyngbyaceae cyanobacterium bins.302]|nr:dual specificity protein phosphatase family protein [Leptolyngbyaceae cyanobacterium bins.302]
MEQPVTHPITENIWWIIPGQLAGVRMPTAEELPQLQQIGVGAIVSVFHEDANLSLYQQANIPFIWLPIAVDSVPNQVQLEQFCRFVEYQNQLGHGVAVHCSTGKHRTGTMLAAYLISRGWAYPDAMQKILDASSQAKLPDPQTQFLQVFTAT